jgi:hypothetical protein
MRQCSPGSKAANGLGKQLKDAEVEWEAAGQRPPRLVSRIVPTRPHSAPVSFDDLLTMVATDHVKESPAKDGKGWPEVWRL